MCSGIRAEVVELVDALDSKSSIRKGVWVRVPPSAPYSKLRAYVISLGVNVGPFSIIRK